MAGCTLMILRLYQTMDFKAVTLIIDDQQMDVSEVPFPAVTIFGRFSQAYELKNRKIESYADLGFDNYHETNETVVIPISK